VISKSKANQPVGEKPHLTDSSTSLINIWKYFNPWATDWDFHHRFLSILNDSEDKPKGVTYVLIDEAYNPQWRQENVFYARARLHQLPDYAENKALLVEQHTEPSIAELERRMRALLTENTDFRHYGLEDGPDMEIQTSMATAPVCSSLESVSNPFCVV
jgi:hypothetical protein